MQDQYEVSADLEHRMTGERHYKLPVREDPEYLYLRKDSRQKERAERREREEKKRRKLAYEVNRLCGSRL